MDINEIKLVIWDLDDTFWKGTLSEEGITPIEQNIELVNNLMDIGIINSINSKNELVLVEKKLEELGVRDKFVFLSVNWETKGLRVKEQISAMNLRAPNVLFIDDNHSNIEEVKYYNPNIMTAYPEDLTALYNYAKDAERKDENHSRFKQYRLLETKYKEKSELSSNEEFLYSSNIKVDIEKDSLNHIERIYDMIIRTNQLNFTKNRISKNELQKILNDINYQHGYVKVSDKFGDYGIVGFYAYKDNNLEHFLFSCRTLGMGIEQYVYSYLEHPEINISGEVISSLDNKINPLWVNQNIKNIEVGKLSSNKENNVKILFKGPCDLEQIFSYIDQTDNIESEFTFVNRITGVSIEQHNHTSHIVQSLKLNEKTKNVLINEVPFSDESMFSNKMFIGEYDIVFLSMLTDGNLGTYKRRKTGETIAFGEYYWPLTDKKNWDGYITGEIFNANCNFSLNFLKKFNEEYEFQGRISTSDVINNLKYIHENMAKSSLLVLMLGSEKPYLSNKNPSYNNRHLVHQEMNIEIRKLAEEFDNIKIVDFNDYIKDQSSYYNNINHFIKPIYYKMANDIISIIDKKTSLAIKKQPKSKLFKDYSKQLVKKAFNKA